MCKKEESATKQKSLPKTRIRNMAARVLPFALCGGLLMLLSRAGHGVPCAFRLVTGLQCPGCGVTTMTLALLAGDFGAARRANPFLFFTLPVLLFVFPAAAYLPLRGKPKTVLQTVLPATYLLALLAFGIWRNMAG